MVISSSPDHTSKPIRAAFKDVRTAPESPLLRNLDDVRFVFPRSYDIVDLSNEHTVTSKLRFGAEMGEDSSESSGLLRTD